MGRVRQSIMCMVAGLMIVGPIIVWFAPWEWRPHKVILVSLIFVSIAGIMMLFDELRTLLAFQRQEPKSGRH